MQRWIQYEQNKRKIYFCDVVLVLFTQNAMHYSALPACGVWQTRFLLGPDDLPI